MRLIVKSIFSKCGTCQEASTELPVKSTTDMIVYSPAAIFRNVSRTIPKGCCPESESGLRAWKRVTKIQRDRAREFWGTTETAFVRI